MPYHFNIFLKLSSSILWRVLTFIFIKNICLPFSWSNFYKFLVWGKCWYHKKSVIILFFLRRVCIPIGTMSSVFWSWSHLEKFLIWKTPITNLTLKKNRYKTINIIYGSLSPNLTCMSIKLYVIFFNYTDNVCRICSDVLCFIFFLWFHPFYIFFIVTSSNTVFFFHYTAWGLSYTYMNT